MSGSEENPFKYIHTQQCLIYQRCKLPEILENA